MELINYDGSLNHRNNTLISPENRSFRYGDGLFETIRMFDGEIPFIKKHFARLKKGMKLLKLSAPKEFSSNFLKTEILKLAPLGGNFKFRVAVFRKQGGLYTPKSNKISFIIEASPLDSNFFVGNQKGISLGIYDEIFLSRNQLSNIKTSNSLPYVLASLYKSEQSWDDCILLNNKIRIAECSSSNIFILNKKTWYTPALSEGCIDGVMRSVVIQHLNDKGITVEEGKLKVSALKSAEECFITNSIQGITWVESFKKTKFSNKKSSQILKGINKKLKKRLNG